MAEQMDDVSIWFLNNTERALSLYQGTDSQYFVTEDGAWAPILSCPLFTIVTEELLSFFKQYACPELESHPVTIIDRVLNQWFDGYHRIFIKDEIPREATRDLSRVDATGVKMWRFQGEIFVSNTLKELLEKTGIKGITPSPGWSGWA